MGRQSKATMARRGNIGRPNNAQKPPVEEVSDEDSDFEDDDLLEHGFFFLDEESLSEEDLDGSDEELDEDELHGLISEAKIEHFNAILFEAQAMAVKAGREASGEKRKRKRHYTGNSSRTRRYHAQKRRRLLVTGQKFINSWFSKEKKLTSSDAPEIIEVSDDSGDSEGEENEDEVDASLQRLFPNTQDHTPPVSFRS